MRHGRIAILLLGATLAHAGGLTVTPVTVELGGKATAMVINLKNSGDEPKRYQLEMMSWGESRSGQMELSPTHDVVFFPQLLSLKAGENRNVRVGITQPPSAVERTYRLFIQELPGMKTAGGAQQVQVLTRVGIPIFVVPAQAASSVGLMPVSVKGGAASFGLTNRGNAYARPTKVVFTASDAQGKSVFDKTWDGWYLLAGGERDYSIQIPADACKHATSFRVEVLGTKLSLSKTVQATPGACGS
jgi:fimbrial chaperone protein